MATCFVESLVRAADVPTPENPHVVRVPFEHLAAAPRDRIDPCSMDPTGAVLMLTDEELAGMKVPFERMGRWSDVVRRFRPAKTMATVGVPSISALLGEPVGAPGGVAGVEFPLTYDRYHTPQEGIEAFQTIAAMYPHLARLESIGRSVENRDLLVLRISDNPGLDEPDEQSIFLCALHHAREWATHEVVLHMAEYLVTQYDTNPRVRNILDRSVVWILLSVNPDGFEYSWQRSRMWRKNRRQNRDGSFGVDINRNFGYLWGLNESGSSSSTGSETYRGTSAASEPETQALQGFLTREKPSIAVTYHTYSQMVLYPWGYTTSMLPQAHNSFRAVGQQYARCVSGVHGANYTPGQGSYALYPTNGDFTDYAYGQHGALAVTLELRPISFDEGGFVLPEDQILPTCEENLSAALWLMDNVADARWVAAPGRPVFTGGSFAFSLPVTPVLQKPEAALGMSSAVASELSTWFDDLAHLPGLASYPSFFKEIGAGSPYFLADRPVTRTWASRFTGYVSLPYLFENGAMMYLENVQPATNYLGLPFEHPVAMRELWLLKRVMRSRGVDFGLVEAVIEARSALEDLHHANPWISWQWNSLDQNGVARTSHPEGINGAEEFLYPFRVYSFHSNVRSAFLTSGSPSDAVYMLLVPSPSGMDVDQSGQVDEADFGQLIGCFVGPGGNGVSGDCGPFDADRDRKVTLRDWAAFQNDFGRHVGCGP